MVTFVEVTAVVTDCRDLDENVFLELLLDSVAEVVVSSDSDLLVLHSFHGIPILARG